MSINGSNPEDFAPVKWISLKEAKAMSNDAGKYFGWGRLEALRDIDARLKNIESALRVPGLPTELRPGAVPNAILELSDRLSTLEAAAEKRKLSDEEIQSCWEAMIKRVHATPLQPKAEPTSPPQTRQPGWYPIFDAAGECTTYYWRAGAWFPFKNSERPTTLIPTGPIGPRIQEPEQ